MIHGPVRPKDPKTEMGVLSMWQPFTFISAHTWHQHPFEFTGWVRELGVVPDWVLGNRTCSSFLPKACLL